jgi:hypothetical protein
MLSCAASCCSFDLPTLAMSLSLKSSAGHLDPGEAERADCDLAGDEDLEFPCSKTPDSIRSSRLALEMIKNE